jgi:hypothetical protein
MRCAVFRSYNRNEKTIDLDACRMLNRISFERQSSNCDIDADTALRMLKEKDVVPLRECDRIR